MPHLNVNCYDGLLFKDQFVVYLTNALSKDYKIPYHFVFSKAHTVSQKV